MCIFIHLYKLKYKGFESCEICSSKVRNEHNRSQTTKLWLSFPNINLCCELFNVLILTSTNCSIKKL